MGIESDHLVFDYLSRVGDLAHSTRMSAAERAKLVGGLRGEIDKARAAEGGAENKAAVKKILGRLGRPEDVVASANGGVGPTLSSAVPSQRDASGDGKKDDGKKGDRKKGDRKKQAPVLEEPTLPEQRTGPSAAFGASSPHLASMDELGPEESDPDWWRVDPSPYGRGPGGTGAVSSGEIVPGFVGGIELPEMLKPPPGKSDKDAKADEGAKAAEDAKSGTDAAGAVEAELPASVTRRGAAMLRRGIAGRAPSGVGPRSGGFVELTAAALLVAGAVTGSFVPLALGWLAAWWSPKLSRIEAKWAAFGMPGLVLAVTGVWLWGRMDGRWGAPIAQGGDAMREAMGDTFPLLLRFAAGASALYLVWRARRPASG